MLIQSNIDEWRNENQILCCDAPIKTIIVYHNGERKYYKAMFEATGMKELISYLYAINQKVDLTGVEEKFSFER
ncbi:hypothetical protein [Algoriphagus sp. NG3]|uniref:hypothetical protein n=1 Tax=Algoriphagus sp. NG3 TaxID=3097546 RepID=UPI002A800832|nr:hypothetical protein [Algoriphagus sp. NG3]WPR73556.1 hypothetical protein SLW71_12795 [Algoriphagus sp. NG3]